MDNFSTNLKKRILKSYLKNSKNIIKRSEMQNAFTYISELELHSFEKSVWFLGKSFYVIDSGIKFEIPAGFCICFDRELNLVSRLILNENFYRVIIVLIWFRDVLEYDSIHMKSVLNSMLMCEGFGLIARLILLSTLRIK